MTPRSPDSEELARLRHKLAEAEALLRAHAEASSKVVVDHARSALEAEVVQDQPHGGIEAAILDALSSHIALIDPAGVIIAVNVAWRRFATANAYPLPDHGLGQNYLTVCEATLGADASDAMAVANGLLQVLAGTTTAFSHEYACHSPNKQRWFLVTITPVSENRRVGAVIAHTNITQRKLAEEELQASESRFRATFEQAAIGVANVAASGRFLRVNQRLCTIVGYEPDELLALTFDDLTFPEHRAKSEAARVAMLAGTKTSFTSEKRYRRKDGTGVWVNLVTTVVQDHNKDPYFISVIEDITERKAADLRLQRLNRLYAVLSRINETIVRVRDPRQLYEQVCQIVVNHGLLRMSFIAERDADSQAIVPVAVAGESGDYLTSMVVVTEVDNPLSLGTIGTAFKTGRYDVCNDFAQDPRMAPWRVDAERHKFRATASFPLTVRGTVVAALVLFAEETGYFQDDELSLMVAIANDLSFALEAMRQERERLTIEEAMRTRERRFRALIEHSTDGIALIDAADEILYLSPAVTAIEGYAQDELVGRKSADNTHPDDMPVVESIIRELLANPGKPVPVLWRRRHKDGRWLWLEGVATNLLADPAVRAIVTNYRDVTERIHTENELLQSQALMRMASRVGRLGAWAIDLSSDTLTWSDEIRAIHEVPADYQPVVATALDFYAPEFRPVVRDAVETCIRSGSSFDVEAELITANGRRVWVRSIGEAVRDQQGVIRRIQGAFQDISDRKQAAEAYRLIAERLTTTLESITEGFYTVDREWRFTYINNKAEQVLRRPREELLGKVLWDEFPDAHETPFQQRLLQAMRDHTTEHLEEYFRPFDAWFEVHIYPSSQGLAVYVQDVSQQRRAIEAMRVSEERFHLLAKATNDAVWDWDLVRDHLWWNEGLETLFGYAPGDVETTSSSWTGRIHPDDRVRVMEEINAAIRMGDGTWAGEYRFRRKDDTYAYIADRGKVICNSAGKAVRMIGAKSDLSQRKQTEERLAEQAALLDHAKDAISVRDLEHRITFWNKGAEGVYGWSRDEVLGRSALGMLYHDTASFGKSMEALLEHNEWFGEWNSVRKNGKKILIEGRWSLLRDKHGKPRAVLAISTNITERRMLEQQFLRAQRLESIGTLAGGIAHDLNNVLTPILLSISLLMRDERDQKRLRTLSIIDASAKRGAEMVKQVLSFARGVEGKRLPVQIPALLREIEKIINDTFLKNIQVRMVLSPNLWDVTGDPTQLHQVLLNLCVNARDAMPLGGFITLAAENLVLDEPYAHLHIDAKPGSYVVIRVEDSGTGMPPEVIEKIFEPFFTTKETGKGTGLGLSTSLAVVKSHGGYLRVYSEPGQGTIFKIYLPATLAEESLITDTNKSALPRGNGELILVVDDESSVRQITRQILETFGYRVVVAAEGTEAIAIFAAQQDSISLVLTDMMMPIMDGHGVIRVLMKMRPGVRIIAASGLTENHVVTKAISSGVKYFLAKPYTAQSLLTKIHEALTSEH